MTRDEIYGLNIVVLAGGWSDESEISLQSGAHCKAALEEAGCQHVELLDVASEGFFDTLRSGSYDVAFIAMHGRFGEDGCIQGLLEILNIPYTFSGVMAHAVSTEKEVAKVLYKEAGIPTPQGYDIASGTVLTQEQTDTLLDTLGLPLFVKPSGNGSSYGVTKVKTVADLQPAIELAGSQGERVLIEQCITGTEISIPVIGNSNPTALPIVEIVLTGEYYDVQAKSEPASMHHVIPARLEAGVYAKAQELAVAAHKALQCRGASRTDFIVTPEGVPYALETNTIPGMTERSLLPDSSRHGGIPFSELCLRFVEFALEDTNSGCRK